MEVNIKICGMKYEENLLPIIACRPDYIGFIFYEKSKRFVGEELNAEFLKSIDPSIKKVGVFVNHTIKFIEEKIKKYGLDLLQLHGEEDIEQCKELKSKGYKIVKAFQVGDRFDFAVTEPYKAYCDYFLFDTKSDGYGGTGKKFNWEIFEKYDNEIPVFLSGGLDLDSVEEIKKLSRLNIHALDLNSKFESEPARKDPAKLKLFIDNIKNEVLG
jgi:phosphoribosylanthranilate isomerase